MSVYQNINGTLTRMDASDLVQLAAVDTEGILGGTPGATTDGQTLVDQLAADDVQAQTDIGQIKTDLSDEVTARSTLGAHNLFPASSIFSSQTVNDLTYTVNSNDTVKINGTITTGQTFAHLNCDKTFTLPAGTYKLTDGFATGSSGSCGIVLRKNNSSGDLLVSTATTDHKGSFTITTDTVVWARVYADNSDGAFSNVFVYPLLTVAEDTDSTFASFTMTNRELTPQIVYNQNNIYICKHGKIVVAQFNGAKPSDIAALNFANMGAKPALLVSTFQCRCDSKPTTIEINTNGTVLNVGYYASYGATYTDLKSDSSKSVYGSICFIAE